MLLLLLLMMMMMMMILACMSIATYSNQVVGGC